MFICGDCGTVAFQPEPPCSGCGRKGPLLLRRPVPADSTWEFQAEGHRREGHFEAFALVWLLVFTAGLVVGAPLPLRGIPLSPAWWAILLAACCAGGTLAALGARQRSRYRLFLSAKGIWLQVGGKSTDHLNWDEITRLDWLPPSAPRHLVIRAGKRRLDLDTGLRDWDRAAALIRQHSPVVPPPTIKQCNRRLRSPR